MRNKILFVGGEFRNKGSEAMVISTYCALKEIIPNAEFVVASYVPRDVKMSGKYGFKIVRDYENLKVKKRQCAQALLYRLIPIKWFRRLLIKKDAMMMDLSEADLVIDLSGFALTDYFGTGRALLLYSELLLSKLFGIPFVIYTQSMGPFNRRAHRYHVKTTRTLAKIFLPLADLIIIRGEITKKYLEEIGIGKKIHVCADSAFLFEPASNERAREILRAHGIQEDEDVLVGIVPNEMVYRGFEGFAKENGYVVLLSETANYIIHKFGAKVIFIPHEFHELESEGIDDRDIIRYVLDKNQDNKSVFAIDQVCSSTELKAIIGQIDLVITSKFHGTVASLSMAKPTIVLGWADKYLELMNMANQGKYVLDYREAKFEDIKEKLDDIWPKLKEINQELRAKIPELEQSARKAASLVGELLRSKKRKKF